MTTLERPRERIETTHAASPQRSSRTGLILAIVAALALALGGLAGWMIRGGDDPGVVLAGEGELTARQEQMFDMVRESELAWQRGDADAVTALFTPTGVFEALGTTYRVDDGSLATFVDNGEWASLDVFEPMLVNGNELFSFHRYRGQVYSDTVTFTTTGDLLIVSHVIHS